MTRDKTKKESKESSDKEINDEIKTEQSDEDQEEVLLIEEGPEQKLLEFYSKEELAKKVNELKEELKSKGTEIEKLAEWKNKYVHLQAEFENAQKRWDKSRQSLRIQNTAYVLKDFLPFYDSFKKAIENVNENDPINQFYNQFLRILKSQNAEPIDVKINDLFDYNIHEALSSIEKDDVPENSILEIVQDGWKLGKDVLRYAKVIISKKPKPPEPEKEEKKVEPEEIQSEDSESNEKEID